MNAFYWLGGLALLPALVLGGWIAMTSMVEQPKYAVVRKDGAIELRDYPALRAAEVVRSGARDAAVRSGFRPLAGYIFARERDGEKIAMTAPVTQTGDAEAGRWRVRFLMPQGYALDDLPAPASADIRLLEIPPRRVAAIRFSGAWRDPLFDAKALALRSWIAAQGLSAAGPATFAYYNDPLTPGFLRRNEVLIEVGAAKAEAERPVAR